MQREASKMKETDSNGTTSACLPALQWKLWIYTNYDCNLRCGEPLG